MNLKPFLISIILAYFIGTVAYVILPKSPPIVVNNTVDNLPYNSYAVKNSFEQKKQTVKKKVLKKIYKLTDNIILKAIFSLPNNRGFVIIKEKSSSKTHSLKIGQSFKKYRLKSVHKNYAIFVKNETQYKLVLKNSKLHKGSSRIEKVEIDNISNLGEGKYTLKKSLLKQYTSSFDAIWEEIGIEEIVVDGKIKGFRITNLSNKSIFKQLGLGIGDVIKSVNNITLTSYAQAIKLYDNIDNTSQLHIVIMRENQEMELDYEIK